MNKDIADLKGTAEDIENSELNLSSRMPSPSPSQKNSKVFEKNAIIDFSQIARRDQVRKILADVEIELFLMVTDGIANQMAGQKKVLVRDIPLGISNREVEAALKKFGEVKKVQIKVAGKWQSAIGHLVSKCLTLLKKKERNTKKVTNNIQLAKLYVKKNIPEEHIKAFGGRSYAEMAALNPSSNRNNANSSGSQKAGLQVNEMAKLLNTVALKLGVTVKKKDKGKVVNQPPCHISEEKKKEDNKKAKLYMSSKHTSEKKKEAYNLEKKINDIKKALEFIMILLKQVKKQGNWNEATAGKSKSMETDDV
ncbi:hypothetical protein G9A89_009470 [Geosiphon pyriformis]|nr:hypothetical protein G9A89_009470 [Geosiphon pyriformis]